MHAQAVTGYIGWTLASGPWNFELKLSAVEVWNGKSISNPVHKFYGAWLV